MASNIYEWINEYGRNLCPGTRPDTFGEGMRVAKDEVRRLLPTPEERVLEDIKVALRQPGTKGSYVDWAKHVRDRYDEYEALKLEIEEAKGLLGSGGDDTLKGRIESMLAEFHEMKEAIKACLVAFYVGDGKVVAVEALVPHLRKFRDLISDLKTRKFPFRGPGTPYDRGRMDCYQDRCENVPFASIGGQECRHCMKTPKHIKPDDAPEYLAGYISMARDLYGEDWNSCKFEWVVTFEINADGTERKKGEI